jgi:hypothetical protein
MGLGNNAEKCNMFGNYLGGPATITWEGMYYFRESITDWANIQRFFLKLFQEKSM